MFAHMVSALKKGALPDKKPLRKRFEAALVKKMGVIKTPYSFWPADPKINPPTKQLLWAAIVLKDTENCRIIEAIIATELEEQLRAKGHPVSMQSLGAKVQHLLQGYIDELIALAPDETCKENLRHLAEEFLGTDFKSAP